MNLCTTKLCYQLGSQGVGALAFQCGGRLQRLCPGCGKLVRKRNCPMINFLICYINTCAPPMAYGSSQHRPRTPQTLRICRNAVGIPLWICSFAFAQTVNDEALGIHEGAGSKPQGPVQHTVMVLHLEMFLQFGSQCHFLLLTSSSSSRTPLIQSMCCTPCAASNA